MKAVLLGLCALSLSASAEIHDNSERVRSEDSAPRSLRAEQALVIQVIESGTNEKGVRQLWELITTTQNDEIRAQALTELTRNAHPAPEDLYPILLKLLVADNLESRFQQSLAKTLEATKVNDFFKATFEKGTMLEKIFALNSAKGMGERAAPLKTMVENLLHSKNMKMIEKAIELLEVIGGSDDKLMEFVEANSRRPDYSALRARAIESLSAEKLPKELEKLLSPSEDPSIAESALQHVHKYANGDGSKISHLNSKLIPLLRSDDINLSARAARNLVLNSTDPTVAREIFKMLKSKDETQAIVGLKFIGNMVGALSETERAEALALAKKHLVSEADSEQLLALRALRKLNLPLDEIKKLGARLNKMLDSPNVTLQNEAVQALIEIGLVDRLKPKHLATAIETMNRPDLIEIIGKLPVDKELDFATEIFSKVDSKLFQDYFLRAGRSPDVAQSFPFAMSTQSLEKLRSNPNNAFKLAFLKKGLETKDSQLSNDLLSQLQGMKDGVGTKALYTWLDEEAAKKEENSDRANPFLTMVAESKDRLSILNTLLNSQDEDLRLHAAKAISQVGWEGTQSAFAPTDQETEAYQKFVSRLLSDKSNAVVAETLSRLPESLLPKERLASLIDSKPLGPVAAHRLINTEDIDLIGKAFAKPERYPTLVHAIAQRRYFSPEMKEFIRSVTADKNDQDSLIASTMAGVVREFEPATARELLGEKSAVLRMAAYQHLARHPEQKILGRKELTEKIRFESDFSVKMAQMAALRGQGGDLDVDFEAFAEPQRSLYQEMFMLASGQYPAIRRTAGGRASRPPVMLDARMVIQRKYKEFQLRGLIP